MKNMWRVVAKILVICMVITLIDLTPMLAKAENEDSTSEDVEGVPEDWEYRINEDGEVILTEYVGEESEVRIPDTLEGYPVTILADWFITGHEGITKLILPKYLKKIGAYAFKNCINLTGDLVIPEGVTEIGGEAFFACNFTGQLTLPSTLEVIGGAAFCGCSFEGELILPEGLRIIGNDSFTRNNFSGRLVIPQSIEEIQEFAFHRCLDLTEVYMPDKDFEIGNYVFEGDTLTIYGTAGSVAQEYAKKFRIPFVDIATLTPSPEPTEEPAPSPSSEVMPNAEQDGEGKNTYAPMENSSLVPSEELTVRLSQKKSDYPEFFWNKNANATCYEVYRSTKKNKGYRRLKILSSEKTSYTDKKGKRGKEYYYKVRAVCEKNGRKQYGNFSNILKLKRQYLTKPVIRVKKSGGSIPEIVVKLMKKQGEFVQIYYQKDGGKKKRIRLRSEKLKKVYRFRYRSSEKHLTIWVRTYAKEGRKIYYSQYAKKRF